MNAPLPDLPARSGTSMNLVPRVALVTGAGRNIGRAIALALAADGVRVVVNARSNRDEAEDVARAIAARGGTALAVLADVADRDAVAKMIEVAIDAYGRLDILVNNAAVRREAKLGDITMAQWRDVLGVTLDGGFLCAQAALPHLRASGAGAVVNVGGLTAYSGAKFRAHVVAAKAGLAGLTRALAHEFAPDGITVNCVSPGLIETVRDTAGATAGHDPRSSSDGAQRCRTPRHSRRGRRRGELARRPGGPLCHGPDPARQRRGLDVVTPDTQT
jgi:3-oxoacyl-[acyl-carrier protein] reductase